MAVDYSTVTELPGSLASGQQLAMRYSRYAFAASFCESKDVLEVACGAGPGLGYLARRARRVVGGDITASLLASARRRYGSCVPLVRFDAHAIPFGPESFDVVLLHEAIYYLAFPERFVDECRRVLRPGGVLHICTVNREWRDFNPSPFSTRYFSARDLAELLRGRGLEVDLFGAFPAAPASARDAVVSVVKRTAVALHLVPRTMRGKAWLKRIVFGRLAPLPPEVDEGQAPYALPARLDVDAPASGYKILYAVGRRAGGGR